MASYSPLTETVTQKINYQTSPKNAAGAAVGLDGPITFTLDKVGVASVSGHDSNNFVGEIDGAGAGVVNVTATAKSQGVTLSETFQVTVTLDPAVTFGFSFTPPA